MQVNGLSLKESKILLNSLSSIIPKKNSTYQYKGKFYTTVFNLRMKVIEWNNEWVDCVVYMCLYNNEDGMFWVRPAKEFYELFKQTDEESKSKEL